MTPPRCTLQILIPEPTTGRILLTWHRPSRTWTLPTGDLRVGEEMSAAAHRVVTDTVSIGVQIGWVTDIAVEQDGIFVLIPGRHVTGRPAANGPYSRCIWAGRDELTRLLPPRRAHQIARALRRRQPQLLAATG